MILATLSVLCILVRVLVPDKKPGGDGASAGFASKVISSLLFCLAGLAAVLGREVTLPRAGMLAAFLLALLGDIFLGLHPFTHKKHKNYFFLLGTVPFLFAQLLYIAVFLSLVPFHWALAPLALLLPVLYLLLIQRGVLAYLCENTLPILVYGLIVSIMVVSGVSLLVAGHPAGFWALPAGLLFALSDTSLFLFNFGSDRVRAHGKGLTALVMLPYYAAQALFALALLQI
jgi:uncharacterized membrane protein YhhN